MNASAGEHKTDYGPLRLLSSPDAMLSGAKHNAITQAEATQVLRKKKSLQMEERARTKTTIQKMAHLVDEINDLHGHGLETNDRDLWRAIRQKELQKRRETAIDGYSQRLPDRK